MRPFHVGCSKKELNQVMLTILSGDKQAIESMRVTDPLYKNSVNIIDRFREQYEIKTYKICADPRPSRKHGVRSKAVLFVVYDDKIIEIVPWRPIPFRGLGGNGTYTSFQSVV